MEGLQAEKKVLEGFEEERSALRLQRWDGPEGQSLRGGHFLLQSISFYKKLDQFSLQSLLLGAKKGTAFERFSLALLPSIDMKA